MRQPDYSGQFKRDVKQSQKRGKDMSKLKTLLGLIIEGALLPHYPSVATISILVATGLTSF